METFKIAVIFVSALTATTNAMIFPTSSFQEGNVKFYIYTRNVASTPDPLTTDFSISQLNKVGFDKQMLTQFIVHGWYGTSNIDYVVQMKNALINTTSNNVIVVDWSIGAKATYVAAVSNVPTAGAAIANFIKKLETLAGASRSQMHVIGHSLGGQVSGFAGSNLRQPNLARISGLDTPDIGFDPKNPAKTLDPTDADFVDEIHTQISLTAKGHADFYPNGGEEMPGCPNLFADALKFILSLLKGKVGLDYVGCDHGRSTVYYQESITNTNCQFNATACNSWKNYKSGACKGNATTVMGIGATKPTSGRVKYFLSTNSVPPYCIKSN